MSKAEKYKDTMMRHTTGAAHSLQKLKDALSTLDVSEKERLTFETLLEKGFELGYAAAREENIDDRIELVSKLVEMDPEKQKIYLSICRELNKVELDYVDDTRKLSC